MQIAYILINVAPGSESKVVEELKRVENVKKVYSIYGIYDVFARVEAETQLELKETITWKIRRIEKVTATQTLLIVG